MPFHLIYGWANNRPTKEGERKKVFFSFPIHKTNDIYLSSTPPSMNWTNLMLTVLLGLSVLVAYGLFLPQNPYAWANIKEPRRRYWIIMSIVLSALCYIIVWIQQQMHTTANVLFTVGNVIFLVGALLWPLALQFFPRQPYLVISPLCLTSFGAFLMWISQCIEGDVLGIVLLGYLLFHVVVVDNLYWSSSYLSLFA